VKLSLIEEEIASGPGVRYLSFEVIRREATMLDVTIQSLGGVAVLRCAGRIVGGRESEILRVAVVSQSNARTVVLDLSEVETLDGRGIGILISLQGWAHANGKKLRLTNPSQPLLELLRLTNLDSVFEIFSPKDPALNEALADLAAYKG
jgi:anti-anti-sigma factor